MYAIETDRSRNLILVTLSGMLSVEEAAAYIDELRDRFVRERFRAGYSMMIDVAACTIQSQDMVRAMAEHMASFPKASRIAVVTGSSLARMQVRRVMTQSYCSIFTSQDEALDWLAKELAAV